MNLEEGLSPGTATEAIMHIWHVWADELDIIFQKMIDRMERLDVPRREILSLLHGFEEHPARPSLPMAEGLTEAQVQLLKTRPNIRLTQVHRVWNEWPDKVENEYRYMAEMLMHCEQLSEEKWPQMGGGAAMDDVQDDISSALSPPTDLRPLLREMLRPANPQKGTTGTISCELTMSMERLSLHRR